MNKRFYFFMMFVVTFILVFYYVSNTNHIDTKMVVNYNGNNLRISIDGVESNTLPTSGNYYLVDYTCKSASTTISWDRTTYQLKVSNQNKEGGVACYLDFQSSPKLADMPVGSYVAYTGNNGCSGESCNGKNANYVSDAEMGYCYSSNYKFIVNGWRIGYTKNKTAYLVSAGATDCMCTNSSGTASSSSCSDYLSASDLYKHFDNMNVLSLKYCNQDFSYGGVCDETTVWAMKADDFQNIVGKALSSSSCFNKYSDRTCGYTNDLIDNGGYYWFATVYGSSSTYTFYWYPLGRYDGSYRSNNVFGVRPVLRLESSVQVADGSGTYEDPYQIINNSFVIQGGAKYVNASEKSSVVLTLVSSEASQMCISVGTSGCSNYIDFATSYILDWSSETDGEKIVYVYYKNSDGEVIASMSRSIILDATAPSNNSVTIGDAAGLTRTLTISSTGADYMCFSNTSSNVNDCTDWVAYATSYNWRLSDGEGEKTVYAFFKDEAGNVSSTSDTITFTKSCLGVGEVYAIDYSGAVVTSGGADVKFCAGTYRLQAWGARGGYNGGKGGYSVGEITLSGTETMYFYVGGAGGTGAAAGFNGGGTTGSKGGAGGGATDIRINTDSLYARVIVAGGGGGKGQDSCAAGAVGGGTSGGGGASQNSCGTQAGGGTQTAGGAVGVYSSTNGANAGTFGTGGNAADGSYDGGAGGGGWYGGGAGASAGYSNGGGGGSGFVYSAGTASNVPSGWLLTSTYYLTNASTTDGAQSTIPTTDGTSTETGHASNGYLKITRLS